MKVCIPALKTFAVAALLCFIPGLPGVAQVIENRPVALPSFNEPAATGRVTRTKPATARRKHTHQRYKLVSPQHHPVINVLGGAIFLWLVIAFAALLVYLN